MPIYESLEKVSVHEIVCRVVEEGYKLQGKLRVLLEKAPPEEKKVASSLYYIVMEPLARLDRRIDYTNGKTLTSTHRLRYRAAIILDSEQEWQAKVPNFVDVVDEVNKILNAAGICAGRDCTIPTCDCKRWGG